MKKTANLVKRILSFVLVCAFCLTAFGCKSKNPSTSKPGEKKTFITVNLSEKTISAKQSVKVYVTAQDEDGNDLNYKVTTSDTSILVALGVKNEDGEVEFSVSLKSGATVKEDTDVDVIAYLADNEQKQAKRTIKVLKNISTAKDSISIKLVDGKNNVSKSILRPGDDPLDLSVSMTLADYTDKSYNVEFTDGSGKAIDTLVYDATAKTVAIKTGAGVTARQAVTMTVSSTVKPSLKQSISLWVLPALESEIVTEDMIAAISNQSITVTGTLKDIRKYNSDPDKDSSVNYEFSVEMEPGKWKGDWNYSENKSGVISNTYVQGAAYGTDGHHKTEELYVNKNNVVSRKDVKDSDGELLMWETRHFYNHAGGWTSDDGESKNGFVADQFVEVSADEDGTLVEYITTPGTVVFDPVLFTYTYIPSDDDRFVSYLAWSFTPLMSQNDSIEHIYFRVSGEGDNAKIDKIIFQTMKSDLVTSDSDGGTTTVGSAYTQVEMGFSKAGSTTVTEPQVHEKQEGFIKGSIDALANAFSKFGTGKNYSFKMLETSSYSPSRDESDYTVEGTPSDSTGSSSNGADSDFDSSDLPTSIGSSAYKGWVTENGAIIKRVVAIEGLSGTVYSNTRTGYKNNGDGTYDVLDYSTDTQKYYGKKVKTGDFFDALPSFDVAAEIFRYKKNEDAGNSKLLLTYELIDSAIVGEVAKALCLNMYAKDAVATTDGERPFMVTVQVDYDSNNQIIPSSAVLTTVGFAYDILGIYGGYYQTVYSNVGNTAIADNVFDGYVRRQMPADWDAYGTLKYYSEHSTQKGVEYISGSELVKKVFGDAVATNANFKKLPRALAEIFDDNVTPQGHDYDEDDLDSEGNRTYIDTIGFTAQLDDHDEYLHINDYDGFLAKATEKLAAIGFTADASNTGKVGSRRYAAFVNNQLGLTVYFENYNLYYFTIDICKTGDWTKPKN